MNQWTELRHKQQEEFNAFPIHFAFGQDQINQKIQELHLDPNNLHEQIVSVGYGGFVLKEDATKLQELLDRHHKEIEERISEDKTGDGFIYSMFLYELNNHEFGYTGFVDDTLDALGYTMKDIQADARLKHGLEKAAKVILASA